MTTIPKPLFRDPFYDGAADPTLIWNRTERAWWMFYTNRRAWSPPSDDVSWVHGTDIGIASSADGGASWAYRGIAQGLATGPGRDTFWAPEIIDDGNGYHMYVSFIRGVPDRWSGHPRSIRHYSSDDLMTWRFRSTIALGSERVIDACIFPMPDGGYRMWFKDETSNHTHAAFSLDLAHWDPLGPAVDVSPHEGPNVFALSGYYWMLIDEWSGLRVLRSDDLVTWQPQERILDASGAGPDDAGNGLHADVVTVGDDAYVFYFTHPERSGGGESPDASYAARRSSIQVARANVVDGRLRCDRDERLVAPILPLTGP